MASTWTVISENCHLSAPNHLLFLTKVVLPGNGEKSIAAFEYTGLDKAVPLDKTSAATGSGKNASVGPVTPTAPGIIFAAARFKTNGTPGAGFLQRSSLKGNAAEDKPSVASTLVRATFTNAAQDWIAQMVAFK